MNCKSIVLWHLFKETIHGVNGLRVCSGVERLGAEELGFECVANDCLALRNLEAKAIRKVYG